MLAVFSLYPKACWHTFLTNEIAARKPLPAKLTKLTKPIALGVVSVSRVSG